MCPGFIFLNRLQLNPRCVRLEAGIFDSTATREVARLLHQQRRHEPASSHSPRVPEPILRIFLPGTWLALKLQCALPKPCAKSIISAPNIPDAPCRPSKVLSKATQPMKSCVIVRRDPFIRSDVPVSQCHSGETRSSKTRCGGRGQSPSRLPQVGETPWRNECFWRIVSSYVSGPESLVLKMIVAATAFSLSLAMHAET